MRAGGLLLIAVGVAQAGVVSRDWHDGRLSLRLDDGAAELEWISPVTFRFARSFGASAMEVPARISHEKITPEFEDAGGLLTMRTRYLTLRINRDDLKLQVSTGSDKIAVLDMSAGELRLTPLDKVFGLMGDGVRLNLHGERLERP